MLRPKTVRTINMFLCSNLNVLDPSIWLSHQHDTPVHIPALGGRARSTIDEKSNPKHLRMFTIYDSPRRQCAASLQRRVNPRQRSPAHRPPSFA